MSIKGKAYIAGIYEHPTRLATDLTLAQIHAQCAKGALEDAGLSKDDVDAYFCAGDAPGLGPMSMVEYMGLKPRHVDSTDTGGSSGVGVPPLERGTVPVAMPSARGRPASVIRATLHLPAAIASAAWPTCST